MNVTMTIKEYKELCYLLEEIEGDLWDQLDFARVEGDEQKIKELEDELKQSARRERDEANNNRI